MSFSIDILYSTLVLYHDTGISYYNNNICEYTIVIGLFLIFFFNHKLYIMAHACCFDQFAGQRRVSLVIC